MAVATYANVLVKSIDFLKMSQGQVKGHISDTPLSYTNLLQPPPSSKISVSWGFIILSFPYQPGLSPSTLQNLLEEC